ncbi:MAG: c-type cytochrome [Betaproteobacteria bacterium]|nr:c-type cytochrome [Betaproteobacteria bacterium]
MRLLSSAALAALLSLSALAPASAQSADVRYLAANCANCHGTDGRSAGGSGMPGLAGLSAAYFVEQMNAFRNGSRQATIMHQLAKGYTDAQIAAMAQYFAAQKADK